MLYIVFYVSYIIYHILYYMLYIVCVCCCSNWRRKLSEQIGACVCACACACVCACAGEGPSNTDLRPLICFFSLQRKFRSRGEEHVQTPLGRSGSETKKRVGGDAPDYLEDTESSVTSERAVS